jgi:sortase A
MNRRRSSRTAKRAAKRRYLLVLEYLFLIFGLVAVDCYVWVNTSSTLYQAYQDWAFDQTLRGLTPSIPGFISDEFTWLRAERTTTPAPAPSGPLPPPQTLAPLSPSHAPEHSAVLGRLDIPRLNIRVMVREGADESTLRRAVGHIPGTALPGYTGNVALAGHRDTFFRALRNIRKDDSIELETEGATYHYLVQSTKIVTPRDVSVLRASGGETLTLVTCYPFYYIGSAPKRFIVHAVQVAAIPQHPLQRGS